MATDIKSKIQSMLGKLSENRIVKKLKGVYFFLEDRYYAVLDKINKYVPIYKVIDPIDTVFPSFLLLILLVLFVILFIAFFPIAPQPFDTILKVTDDSGKVLEGATINLSSLLFDQNISDSTDAWGELHFKIPKNEVTAVALVSKSNFETVVKEVTLLADETTTIELKPRQIGLQEKTAEILLVNSKTGSRLNVSASVSFECSSGDAAPPTQTRSDGRFTITIPANCGRLTATANASGFNSNSKTVIPPSTTINLTPVETKGKVHVTVKNFDGTNAADVQLSLLDSTTNAEIDSGSTASSGTYEFDEIEPGTYKINASPQQGAPITEPNITVQAGRTSYVIINLPEVLQGKNLFVRIIDANSGSAVVGATIFFYTGKDLFDSKVSDSDGKARQMISDENASYMAVVSHPSYLTTIVDNVPVKDASDTHPYAIQLTKKINDPPNYPTIFVKVLDEAGAKVQDAEVWIYSASHPDIPLNYPAGKTNADGNYVFTSLPAGTYFAMAKKGGKDGNSASMEALAGQTIFLTVVLVLGEGQVKVTVFDSESKEKLRDATVEFIAVHPPNLKGRTIDYCTTDAKGECTSKPIGADKIVYVRASKQNFLPALGTSEIHIVNKSTKEVAIGLIPINSIPNEKVITEFVKLCEDWECTKTANKLESNPVGSAVRTYYAQFRLLLSQDSNGTYSDIKQHIRVGPNSMVSIPPQAYNIKMLDARAPASSMIPSSCWDKTNNFYNPSCVDTGAYKMANASWDGMKQAMIPITIKFVIESGLREGTEIPIYYQAKAKFGNVEYTTQEKVELFKIGQIFCEDKKFAWGFMATNTTDGNAFIIQADAEEDYILQVSAPYKLDYWIYNCSGYDVQARLTVENRNPTNAIEFEEVQGNPPFEIFFLPFQKSTIISSEEGDSNAIKMFTSLETGESATDVVLRLLTQPSLQNGHEKTIHFRIVADANMDVVGLPQKLSDVAQHPDLTGKVIDATSSASIQGASAKLIIPAPKSQTIDALAPTDVNGFFSFGSRTPNLSGVDEVALEVRKAGYRTFITHIPVGGLPVVWNPDFECVEVDKNKLYLRRDLRNSDSFNVVTRSCKRPVEIVLESELVLSDDPPQVVMGADALHSVQVTAQLNPNIGYPFGIGEYFVDVRARFDQDNDGRFTAADGAYSAPIRKVRVFITDPRSCFRLADPQNPNDIAKMKSSFDISQGSDDGLIINNCFYYIEDTKLPTLTKHWVSGTNPEVFSINVPALRRTEPEKVNRSIVIGGGTQLSDNYEVSITPNGGFVELQWIDFFMTDGNHNTGARHRVWAELSRDGCAGNPSESVVGDCFNITGQYPRTEPQAGCVDPKQEPAKCPTLPHPIISNSNDAVEDGWVDTDTYQAPDARYENQTTKDPIWQAAHNVCNALDAGTPCSVPDFKDGQSKKPYFLGKETDRAILEIDGSSTPTFLHGVSWEYWNYDISHEGKINFELANNSLVGETYALLKTEDSVKGIQEPIAIPFSWTVRAQGTKKWTENDPIIMGTSSSRTIQEKKMMGIAADPNAADPRRKFYDFNSDLELSDPITFTSDPNFRALVNDLGKTKVAIKKFTVEMAGCSKPNCMGNFFMYFYMEDGWHFGVMGEGLDAQGAFTMEFNTPQEIFAYTLINEGENPGDLTVESFEQEIYHEQVTDLNYTGGEDTIPAGESMKGGIHFSIPIQNPEQYSDIIYTVSTTTPEVFVYFNELGQPVRTTNPNAEIVAVTSSPVVNRVTQTEYFHIRLLGGKQTECLAYDGTYGATGEKNKPRVKFDWRWWEIDKETCAEGNPDYIYCDAVQFVTSLLFRLDEIGALAESGLTEENLTEINRLKLFNVYVVQDGVTIDLRNDLAHYLTTEVFESDPAETLLSSAHPWQNYLTDPARLTFSSENLTAGLYEVYLTFGFDGEDYKFFYNEQPIGTITVNFAKIADPPVDNPLYRMPIDATVGRNEDGTYDRQGYGVKFNNTSGEPIVLVGNVGEASYVATESDSGSIADIETVIEKEFSYANNTNKGALLSITKGLTQMVFSPSIATPVLLEMNSANNKATAFYYLSTAAGAVLSSASGFMNSWTGAASTMGEHPSQCRAFDGSDFRLFYMQPDRIATGNECTLAKTPSYGFPYGNAANNQKIFLETVFFAPRSMATDDVVLHDSCAQSNAVFYSPRNSGSQIGLTDTSGYSISSVQDIIDLIGNSYVCVSEDSDKVSFWWNPQKLVSELNTVKQSIPNWSAMECIIPPTGQSP